MKFMKTKHKKIAVSCLMTILLSLIFAFLFPAEAKNNIAFECKIDSFCGESGEEKSAPMLVDDDPNYETKWETSDGASHPGEPHWIILDFGSEKIIDSIRLIKASQGAEDFGKTELDASGLRFEVSSDKKNWVIIDEVTNDGGNDIYEGFFIPVIARYLKLVITRPEQDENSHENQAVRLYDLKVFEYIPPIEEENEEPEETSDDIEPDLAIDDDLNAPKTYDSLMIFLIFSGSALIISRIFSNQRSRSV
ncbi:MAG: discoidin domain-containing protein [Oscillospiraceae bacterium]|nr:discoidin domain-containing protein [Oscillospiraceae bacterium]